MAREIANPSAHTFKPLAEAETIPTVEESAKQEPRAKRRGRPKKEGAIYGHPDFSPTNFVVNRKAYWIAHARLKEEDPKKTMSHIVSEFIKRYGKRQELEPIPY